MQVGVPVIRVPRRMIVVVLMVGRVLLLGEEFGVPRAVIPAAVRDHAPVADEEKLVDEAVAAGIDVGDERVERGRIDALGLRRRDGPRPVRPSGLHRLRPAGGQDQAGRYRETAAHHVRTPGVGQMRIDNPHTEGLVGPGHIALQDPRSTQGHRHRIVPIIDRNLTVALRQRLRHYPCSPSPVRGRPARPPCGAQAESGPPAARLHDPGPGLARGSAEGQPDLQDVHLSTKPEPVQLK